MSSELNFMENLYIIELENKIIENSTNFYNKAVQDKINSSENKFVNYLYWGENCLQKEEQTLSNFLPDSTISKS